MELEDKGDAADGIEQLRFPSSNKQATNQRRVLKVSGRDEYTVAGMSGSRQYITSSNTAAVPAQ